VSNRLIRSGLEQIVATWAAAKSPAIPVAYDNQVFTPPEGRYLRVLFLPGQTTSEDLDGLQRTFVGVFQVSLYMPNGQGAGASHALEEELIALYPKETEIVSGGLRVRLTRPMSAAVSIPGTTHYHTPISCAYRADN